MIYDHEKESLDFSCSLSTIADKVFVIGEIIAQGGKKNGGIDITNDAMVEGLLAILAEISNDISEIEKALYDDGQLLHKLRTFEGLMREKGGAELKVPEKV